MPRRRLLLTCTLSLLAAGLVGMSLGHASNPRGLAAKVDASPIFAHMPGPAVEGHRRDATELNAECEHCHEDIAAEWRESLHAQAWTDPAFQRSYARERKAFCRSCHAPEADPALAQVPEAAAHVGVGCVSCHVPGDEPAGGPVLAGSGARTDAAPHGLMVSTDFSEAPACARCHEFDFPDRPASGLGAHDMMQSTMSEHAVSRYADVSCGDCHMPRVAGTDGRPHRSHRFGSSRDPNRLREAVVARAWRESGGLVVRLEPGIVGHAFPTGDLFRRLVVEGERLDPHGRVLHADRRILRREFDVVRGPDGELRRIMTADLRVGASSEDGGAVEVFLEPGAPDPTTSIRWRVIYEPAEFPPERGEHDSPWRATVADGRLLPPAHHQPPEPRP